MDMPDGWVARPHDTYSKRHFHVTKGVNGWFWYSGPGRYFWFERNVRGEHGGFPDPVSCAVACELATGGCADGHA
jgi:hypothetical protein